MPDFNVRSDSVNVEQIMEQIRGRIREKRGVDYTEQQIRELAEVKLERFLDPRGVRSDLLEQFRKAQPREEELERPNFAFEDATLFESHRAPIRWLRKLLLPILKLFLNPNPLIQALHIQGRLNTINAERESARRAMDQLYYELIHNLVVEATRTGIEVKNLKMRLESVSSRLEFNERRARALESAVVYKPSTAEEPVPQRAAPPPPPPQQRYSASQPSRQQQRSSPPPPPLSAPAQSATELPPTAAPGATGDAAAAGTANQPEGPGQRSRRRRRRRGRRGGGTASSVMGAQELAADPSATMDSGDQGSEPGDELDAMDDDRGPAPEDSHVAAAENVEQALSAEVQRTEPMADSTATVPMVMPDVPGVPREPTPIAPPAADETPVAPAVETVAAEPPVVPTPPPAAHSTPAAPPAAAGSAAEPAAPPDTAQSPSSDRVGHRDDLDSQ